MLKAYKYKLNPNEEQKVLLNKHFGSIRFVYNHFLNERKTEYETNKQSLSYFDNAKTLTILKTKEEYSWLKEINAQSLQHSLKHLEGAYNGFFKKRTSFPKFKSKHGRNSFHVPQFITVKKDKLYFPKFKEGINIILHRKFVGEIRQCTVSKNPTGEYFASILVETSHILLAKTGKTVGIDLGLKDFIVTSDDVRYKNHRYTKKYEKELKIQQQHLCRKKKGSKRYEKQRLKVARVHKKITNSRVDNLHKISTDLITKYDTIMVEDLNVKGMVKNHKLAKHISDAAWGKFIEFLTYKSLWNEKQVVKVDRFFPSSKRCHKCGYINQGLKLDVREWVCPSCKTKHDRDHNASINILQEGYKTLGLDPMIELSSGTDENRRGDEIRPTSVGIVDEPSKISFEVKS